MSLRPVMLSSAPTIPAAFELGAEALCRAVGNNVGNLAFIHAIDTHLGGNVLRHRRLERPEVINASASDVAVLPCANHLGTHIDLGKEAEHFRRIDRPMVAIGLGAQGRVERSQLPELPEGSVRWLRELAERAPTSSPNITVRGEFTQRVLEQYGLVDKSVVLGCPEQFDARRHALMASYQDFLSNNDLAATLPFRPSVS